MLLKPKGWREERVIPRAHHWMIAAAVLFVMTHVMPVMASLI